jgi:hypothetical protein
MVELYLHSPSCLHCVVIKWLQGQLLSLLPAYNNNLFGTRHRPVKGACGSVVG